MNDERIRQLISAVEDLGEALSNMKAPEVRIPDISPVLQVTPAIDLPKPEVTVMPPNVRVDAPKVEVKVPEAKTPEINFNPDIKVQQDARPFKIVVHRDDHGFISHLDVTPIG